MTGPQMASPGRAVCREYRSRTTLAAVGIGVPLAAGLLYLIHYGPWQHPLLKRYVSHPVEVAEIILFCGALGALLAKFFGWWANRRAFRAEVLPPWDGQQVPVAEATGLLAGLDQLPRRLQNTLLVRRVAAVLDFLRSRGSANELDDQVRSLADNDSLAVESSYSLIRFITWAIPILGFLGTVLGITEAISGVTPEVLEQSLSTVTDGLALAFDTTAVALALTMVVMFLSFVTERCEEGVLQAVDGYVDRQLAHRFERASAAGGEFIEVVRQHTQVLLKGVEELVQRQAAVWANALAESDRRRTEAETRQQDRLGKALETALEQTLQTHQRRLAELQKQAADQGAGLLGRLGELAKAVQETGREQQAGLGQVAQKLAAQAEALVRLQEGEGQLVRLQEQLDRNLAALAGAGTLDQAVHSLTAAIHLLTARASAPAGGSRPSARPGAAA